MDPVQRVKDSFSESIQTKSASAEKLAPLVAAAAELMTDCLLNENKIMACGNGVSAAHAQHFSSQMLNRFDMERPGLPAIALTTDSSTLTSIADDYQFADVFAKQIRALGRPGDLLLAFSAGGESHNLIHAIDAAHDRGMKVVALTGCEGGQIADQMQQGDMEIRVPSWSAPRIHEVQVMILHALCDLIDHRLLGVEG